MVNLPSGTCVEELTGRLEALKDCLVKYLNLAATKTVAISFVLWAKSATRYRKTERNQNVHISKRAYYFGLKFRDFIPQCARTENWDEVAKKNNLLWFFTNISPKDKNFKTKFYRLVDDSFLHLNAKYHQHLLKKTQVISLIVSAPYWFWWSKNMLRNIMQQKTIFKARSQMHKLLQTLLLQT